MLDAATSTTHPTGAFVSSLTSNGTIGNVVIAFDFEGRRAMHMIAYNMDLETFSAGTLHIEDCIRDAFSAGLKVIDFLGPKVKYKMDWCDRSVEMLEFQHALSLKGRVYGMGCRMLGCTPGATLSAVLPRPVRRALSWGLRKVRGR